MYQKGLLPDRIQCRMENHKKKQVKSDLSIHGTDSTDSTEYSAVHAVMDGTLSLLLLYTHFRLLACCSSSILLRQSEKVWSNGGAELQCAGCRMCMYYACRVQCMIQAE